MPEEIGEGDLAIIIIIVVIQMVLFFFYLTNCTQLNKNRSTHRFRHDLLATNNENTVRLGNF